MRVVGLIIAVPVVKAAFTFGMFHSPLLAFAVAAVALVAVGLMMDAAARRRGRPLHIEATTYDALRDHRRGGLSPHDRQWVAGGRRR